MLLSSPFEVISQLVDLGQTQALRRLTQLLRMGRMRFEFPSMALIVIGALCELELLLDNCFSRPTLDYVNQTPVICEEPHLAQMLSYRWVLPVVRK